MPVRVRDEEGRKKIIAAIGGVDHMHGAACCSQDALS